MSGFFRDPYRARSTNPGGFRQGDPQTSRDAAESIDTKKMRYAVYAVVKRAGARGMIWDEIVAASGMRRQSVAPRYKELRRDGIFAAKVVDGVTVKRIGDSGRNQTVWIVIEEGEPVAVDPKKTPLGRLRAAWDKASEEVRQEFLAGIRN